MTMQNAPTLTDLLSASIKSHVEHSLMLAMAHGVPPELAQRALETALATITIGTFQSRMQRESEEKVSAREACLAMSSMVVDENTPDKNKPFQH